MIGVVDTGGANLMSLFAAFARLGRTSKLVDSPAALGNCSHVVLPGVGAAGEAMQRLQSNRLADPISKLRVPVLGICLGMQLLFDSSAEDETKGLAILPGRVDALVGSEALPVPHMGWSRLNWLQKSALSLGIDSGAYFYFVHSFAVTESALTMAAATHGKVFSAVIEQNNFFGTQFHPERSGKPGSRLLENFLAL